MFARYYNKCFKRNYDDNYVFDLADVYAHFGPNNIIYHQIIDLSCVLINIAIWLSYMNTLDHLSRKCLTNDHIKYINGISTNTNLEQDKKLSHEIYCILCILICIVTSIYLYLQPIIKATGIAMLIMLYDLIMYLCRPKPHYV
jgi:hypothetical protein